MTIKHCCQHLEQKLSLVSLSALSGKGWRNKFYLTKLCKIVCFILLVPNCPLDNVQVPNCLGVRLSAFTLLVTSCLISLLGAVCLLGAKLSVFTILVPNCPILWSCCQIVCFYDLVAKLSGYQIGRWEIVLAPYTVGGSITFSWILGLFVERGCMKPTSANSNDAWHKPLVCGL